MTRDKAMRLDAMLMAARGNLDMIAHYIKSNMTEEYSRQYIAIIGNSMAELIDISTQLHSKYPDIIPDELL